MVLLEQGTLSCGTTWHAAGLVGLLRASESGTRLVQYSSELYAGLEAETGLSTGLPPVRRPDRGPHRGPDGRAPANRCDGRGFRPRLRDALCRAGPGALAGDRRSTTCSVRSGCPRTAGPTRPTSPSRSPRARAATVSACTSGCGSSVSTRPRRARGRRVTGVRTDSGDIEAEVVVNCAGQWAKALGDQVGVTVPLHSAEHFYVVTDQLEGVHAGPADPARPRRLHLRQGGGRRPGRRWLRARREAVGLAVGDPVPVRVPAPRRGLGALLDPDGIALKRIPALAETGIRKFYNGPESFTPDNQFLLGEAPGLAGYFVGAGFNSVGIASAGGAGRALAEWIVQGEPSMDLTSVDVRRFSPYAGDETLAAQPGGRDPRPALRRAVAQPRAGDRARRPALAPARARWPTPGPTFGTRNGWERPLYFGPPLDYGWGKPDWLEHSAAEQVACRTAVAVFDQTSFSKYLVRGRDALATLQWVCAADVDVAGRPGRLHAVAQCARLPTSRTSRSPGPATSASSSSPVPRRPCATWPGSTSTWPAAPR